MPLLFVLMTGLFGVALAEKFETIETRSGRVKGINLPTKLGNVVQFRHIPFAEPPVGDLRFRKPLPVRPWTETYDATAFGPSCIQHHFLPTFTAMLENKEISEDCLGLNIYVPNNITTNEKKSVMIWVHGGGFQSGQGHIYDCSLFSVVGEVIMVTINYRLGIFGFLSTGDSASPGNYGLWDQIMAFKWVKNNIAAFGGDPESITIFGQSAGALSVTYQMIIPENRGLFHRVIAQSGGGISSILPFAPFPLKYAKKFGQRLNCTNGEDTTYLIDCIKKFDAKDILEAQMFVQSFSMKPETMNFIPELWPSNDGELIRGDNPVHHLNQNQDMKSFYQSLDLIAGTTTAEGMFLLVYAAIFQEMYKFNITEGIPTTVLCDHFAPLVANYNFNDINGVAAKAICEFYRSNDNEQQGRQLVDLIGDPFMTAATVESLLLHTTDNERSSYQYIFSKHSESHILGSPPPWDTVRSDHGSELEYFFSLKSFSDPLQNDKTSEIFFRLVNYWTNFAKTGNPNGEGLPVWPRFETNDKSYLELNYDITQGRDVFSDRVKYLLEKIQQLVRNENLRVKKGEL